MYENPGREGTAPLSPAADAHACFGKASKLFAKRLCAFVETKFNVDINVCYDVSKLVLISN